MSREKNQTYNLQKIFISFQKLKMTSEDTSLNNTFNEFTLKYFSLVSIRSEQKNKICSSERGSSQELQKGGSSPFNKNKYVTCEWPCKRERAVSSRLVKQWDGSQYVSFGKTMCHLYSGYPSHSRCQSSKNIIIQTRVEVRKGDEFIWDIAIKGILSSRICCRITSDANMAGGEGRGIPTEEERKKNISSRTLGQ